MLAPFFLTLPLCLYPPSLFLPTTKHHTSSLLTVFPIPTPTPSSTLPTTTIAMCTAPALRAAPTQKESPENAIAALRPATRQKVPAKSDATMPAMYSEDVKSCRSWLSYCCSLFFGVD